MASETLAPEPTFEEVVKSNKIMTLLWNETRGNFAVQGKSHKWYFGATVQEAFQKCAEANK